MCRSGKKLLRNTGFRVEGIFAELGGQHARQDGFPQKLLFQTIFSVFGSFTKANPMIKKQHQQI
jgi:hypothetical protein